MWEMLKDYSHPGPRQLSHAALILPGSGLKLERASAWEPVRHTVPTLNTPLLALGPHTGHIPSLSPVPSPLNGSSINDCWINNSSSSPLPFINSWKSFWKSCEILCLSQTRFGLFLDSMSFPHFLPESWPECFPFQSVGPVYPCTASYVLSERMNRSR